MSAARDAAAAYSGRASDFEASAAALAAQHRIILSLADRHRAAILRRAARAETWDPDPAPAVRRVDQP